MKIIYIFPLLFITLALGCGGGSDSAPTPAPTSTPAPVQIQATTFTPIINGDIESGDVTNWGVLGDAVISATSDQALSGDYSMLVTIQNSGAAGPAYTAINFIKGKTYNISVHAKLVNSDTTALLGLVVLGMPDFLILTPEPYVAINSENWTQLSATYTHTLEEPNAIYFITGSVEEVVGYYIDDLVITELP